MKNPVPPPDSARIVTTAGIEADTTCSTVIVGAEAATAVGAAVATVTLGGGVKGLVDAHQRASGTTLPPFLRAEVTRRPIPEFKKSADATSTWGTGTRIFMA